jgi:hypothetical protein
VAYVTVAYVAYVAGVVGNVTTAVRAVTRGYWGDDQVAFIGVSVS